MGALGRPPSLLPPSSLPPSSSVHASMPVTARSTPWGCVRRDPLEAFLPLREDLCMSLLTNEHSPPHPHTVPLGTGKEGSDIVPCERDRELSMSPASS